MAVRVIVLYYNTYCSLVRVIVEATVRVIVEDTVMVIVEATLQ